MISLAATSVAPIKPPTMVHSIDTQTSTKSPVKLQRQIISRQPAKYLESESDSVVDVSLQEERRLEFQQRRLRQLQKKRMMTQNDADRIRRDAHHGEVRGLEKSRFEVYPATNFAIGQPSTPQASKSQAISSFFPPVCSTDNKVRRYSSTDVSVGGRPEPSVGRRFVDVVDGRHLAAVDGDEIFIPKLDLDELVRSLSVRETLLKHFSFQFFRASKRFEIRVG